LFLHNITIIYSQTFTNYTTADGLVDNSVNCVDVDANDNIWFGTQNGISKFDGTSWETHTISTDSGIIHNTIAAICVMNNGDVWVGTDYGASKFDGTQWTAYTEADGLGDNRINHIDQGPDGKIWFGDYDGVTVYDGTSWTSYNMSDGLPFGGIYYTSFDSNGDSWLASDLGGLIKFDGTSFTIYDESDGLINDGVRAIAIDDQDNKWTGTADGISVFNNANIWTENHTMMLLLPPPDTLNPIEDVKINSIGHIWAGIYVDYLVTEGGVAMYNGNTWTGYDVSDGLIGPVVRGLAIDSQDFVWVATSTGVSKISNIPGNVNVLEKNSYNVYPNPTSGELTLDLDNTFDNITINIRTVTGKLVSTKKYMSSRNISLEINEPPGIYIVEVTHQK
jgi:ligand-binding sensor domain-containing protein